MKRRELREHIFQLLFRVEFNGQDEMAEQVSLYVEDMKEEEIVEPKDETYIEEKYKKIVEKPPEIDELLAAIRDRPTGTLPPDVEARLWGFAERASTLTGTERTILQYYMDGYTVKDIPELACISASTVKTHNRNLYRKLEVDSFDELKVYIELFASCGRSSELLNK